MSLFEPSRESVRGGSNTNDDEPRILVTVPEFDDGRPGLNFSGALLGPTILAQGSCVFSLVDSAPRGGAIRILSVLITHSLMGFLVASLLDNFSLDTLASMGQRETNYLPYPAILTVSCFWGL